jgi:DNA adenine methylase
MRQAGLQGFGMPRLVQLAERPLLPPPLKWAGGKRWLVPELQRLWQGHEKRRLVEPFVGGMAIALNLRPNEALLNDHNVHLVNFYEWLQKGLKIDVPSDSDEETYYANRNRFNEIIARKGGPSSRQAAMLFYYLNRNCYNGLCRFNRSGEFNTPHGKYKNPQFVEDLTPYKGALAGWDFRSGDFESVRLRKSDFVYADPPYDNAFTSYSSEEFGWKDQERLAHWLADHEGPVVASNHATDRIVELYGELGFELEILQAPRMINCTGDRTPVLEMIATLNL